ncbi:galectin-2 [Ochotona curzoniae]|uniref:galectin-2 n=1 Tax=Ochotona curzoniae TaxID=130825 RepID=UPI001B34AB94|nr:galectin-2 [Ochotona curzoniae]
MSTKFEMTNLDLKEGTSLKLKGKIHESSDGFIINLGQEADTLCMHFNPRFKESTIVCNSKDGGKWGKEQRESHLGFGPGSEVKFTVTFEGDKFKVKLPDGHEVIFPNRLGHSQLNYLAVHGGLRVSSIKFE